MARMLEASGERVAGRRCVLRPRVEAPAGRVVNRGGRMGRESRPPAGPVQGPRVGRLTVPTVVGVDHVIPCLSGWAGVSREQLECRALWPTG